ncbi:FAD/FMN-containing dehydrogenase [Aspergillus sclerotioniger CBS 115572]|uniref:FAD/FMN-containing dehydrogenase n=1 Tax=Aspergillus sclerotioniger CBS 115572 TaxID=1450535 RepID=A0A317V7W1_9EURO|nr:FAD/FMN-containing dehydrogenase [Aspergillus sclerotioniger CBS 115572]PWY68942.1 FAD/FMN-containing dehydrogenase [Aspergillus sclerotioniger CBS 115572]
MKASWTLAAIAALTSQAVASSDCHCLPGDSCWPSTSTWESLNSTVGGRLVATVPIGTPCHDPTYNGTACTDLQDNWYYPQTHFVSSSSVMQPYFANQSCDPFTAESKPCVLGNYVSYAVNVSSTADVVAAVQFAQSNNIRLVIRNTGHDYLGRSTGAGALSVWTHYLNDVEVQEWSDSTYEGKAVKLGSGVMGYQVLDALYGTGIVVVGGECPTVGLAGGFTMGGGHSALSTSFGLGADQTLSFEVVTASGEVVTASRTNNTDLYWALSGGGAGNFGVVTSLTVKGHEDATVSGAEVEFTVANITSDLFFEAVARFHTLLPAMVDAGTTVIYEMTNQVFLINPLTAYNKTSAEVKTILSPFLSALTELGIEYTVAYTEFSSYFEHYEKYMGPLPYGNLEVGSYNYGGRLLPRETLETNTTNLVAALRSITSEGVIAVGVGLNVTHSNDVSNAVFAPWRSAAVTMQIGSPWNETAPWSEMVANQEHIADSYVPQLEAVTPNSGAYENEASFRQHNWQEAFFGDNYAKLCEIKEKYDPNHVFYVLKGAGSEYWSVDESGRMCKTEQSCSA